ncbi:hypothetical protein KY330_00715 [Candidatus Woesearchaeota archaeon]|nr:hypothetical protein [Candidatus Woesearchaeota archaeon]
MLSLKVSAQSGCCYSIGASPCVPADSCVGVSLGIYFNASDSLCLACNAEIGCCCYGDREAAYTSSGACSALTNFVSFDPTVGSNACDAHCAGVAPACVYQNCAEANTLPCSCGTQILGVDSALVYCCGDDNAGYTSKDICYSVSSCRRELWNISGKVTDEAGAGLPNVRISLDQAFKTTTNVDGNYIIEFVVGEGRTYTIGANLVGFNDNSTTVTIVTANVENVNLILGEAPGIDTDGDGVIDEEDACPYVKEIQTVVQKTDEASDVLCKDGIDNDCDEYTDCADTGCQVLSYCVQGTCGDGLIQQPNINGVDEECEAGNDARCPGRCILTGPNQCLCSPLCGDGWIQKGEVCDGYVAPDGNVAGDLGPCLPPSSLGCIPPGETGECTCRPASICGDGVISSGYEVCDFNEEGDFGCPEGSFCDLNCKICKFKTQCGNGIKEVGEACDGADSPEGCMCRTDCRCQSICFTEPDSPSLVSVSAVKATPAIRVDWNPPNCAPNLYNLYRCEGSCSSNVPSLILTNTLNTEYVDDFGVDDIKPRTNYCYIVGAYYASTSEGVQELFSNEVCVYSGDEQCFEPTIELCVQNVRVRCNNTNFLELIMDCNQLSAEYGGNYICMGPNDAGITKCEFQSSCDECNSILGLYGADVDFSYTSYKDDEGRESEKMSCRNIPACYFDYSETSVDKFNNCWNITSCYDYRSKEACVGPDQGAFKADRCDVGNCVWVDSAYSELGIGVCKPTEEELENCSKCNSQGTYHFNSVYGACNAESCSLFGSCFYDEYTPDYVFLGQCKHKRDFGCVDYDTRVQCIGSNNVNVVVDVQWDANKDKKISGSNIITTPSQDVLGLGKCRWLELDARCVKDSDGSNDAFPDCLESDVECQRDFSNPVTILPDIDVSPRLLDINVSKYDDVSNVGDSGFITWYSIVKKGQFAYPNIAAYQDRILHEFEESGEYVLYYFSEDRAKNLELVKTINFTADAIAPGVKFDYDINGIEFTDEAGDLFYLSNFNLTMTARDDIFDNVTCKAKFVNPPPGKNGDFLAEEGESGSVWTGSYYRWPDGIYVLDYYCVDAVGNVNDNKFILNITEDISLDNPLPNKTLAHNGEIALSIRTAVPAKCRYSESSNSYNDMTPFQVTGGLYHTAIERIPQTNIVKKYNVKCELTKPDGSTYIRGTKSDRIIFAIDMIAPNVDTSLDLGNWYTEDIQVDYICDDPNEGLVDPETEIDWSFDKCKVYYCEGAGCNPVQQTEKKYSVSYSVPVGVEKETIVRYRAADTGPNLGSIVEQKVKIDKHKPEYIFVIKDLFGNIVKNVTSCLYAVYISPTDPLDRIESLWFNAGPEKFEIPPERISRAEFPNPWVVSLYLPEDDFADKELIAGFSIIAFDDHGNRGDNIKSGKYFGIDTRPPSIAITPDVSTFMSKSGTMHYTNNNQMFVSGTTNEPGLNLTFNIDGDFHSSYQEEDSKLIRWFTGFYGTLGDNKIQASGSRLGVANVGDYLSFPWLLVREYPNANKRYRVESIALEGSATVITLDEPLDRIVVANHNISVYTNKYPSNWFRGSVEFNKLGDVNLSVKASDFIGNSFETEPVNVFFDNLPLRLFSMNPRSGSSIRSTSVTNSIVLGDLMTGSGLDTSSIELAIDGIRIELPDITQLDSLGNYRLYEISHASNLLPGNHSFSIKAKDVAGNTLEVSNDFDVNVTFSDKPVLNIDNGVYDGILDRWFVNSPGNYTFEFSEPIIEFQSSLGSCTNVNNKYFVCDLGSLQDGDYDIEVKSKKSDTSAESSFRFVLTIDSVAPEPSLIMTSSKVSNGQNLVFDLNVDNENYDSLLHYNIFNVSGEDIEGFVPKLSDNRFYMEWPVPILNLSAYDFTLNFTDKAGNNRVLARNFEFISSELAFSVNSISVQDDKIFSELSNGFTTYYTSKYEANVKVRADNIVSLRFENDVCKEVRTGEGTYDPVTGLWSIPVQLNWVEGGEIENNVRLIATDAGGNEFEIPLKIIVDRKPPGAPNIFVKE